MLWDCNKSEFAAIVSKSRSFIELLDKMGVIFCDYGGRVLLKPSLRRYFFDYLYHLGNVGRDKEFLNAIRRISKLSIKPRRRNALCSCRLLLPLIKRADLNLSVLKILKRLGGNFSPLFINTAEKNLENLRDQLQKSKIELRQKILAANIPNVAAETILLARYVDCDKWQYIAADFNISLSTAYRLHRQGVAQFKKSSI